MRKDAILDETRIYRYLLSRQWGETDDNFVNFILLNPSTADENSNDMTIKKCIRFSQSWGYDGIWITNLFAFRATKPQTLKQAKDPIGKENDVYIKKYAKKAKIIIIAWGHHGNFLDRGNKVIEMLRQIKSFHCLKILKNGSPKHPLYVHYATELIEYP